MDFLYLIFFFFIIIPSSIIHEYAHGWMANYLGDPTAKYAGRLTLNPLVHIDTWGTLLMPLMLFVLSRGSFVFAYAKPVPFNPYNLRDQKWGSALVGMAGPLANIVTAIFFGILIRILPASAFVSILSIIVYANILLAVFNLVPIPPLDGSKVLYALLPETFAKYKLVMERYGIIILLFFVFYLFQFVSPLIFAVYRLIVGQSFGSL